MSLIVQKFGGTSLADLACIDRVSDIIKAMRDDGHDVVVVLSAMGHETDRLLGLARETCVAPPPRELDALLATGEQVSTALMSMRLISKACAARSFTGAQAGIRTDPMHTKARITGIEVASLRAALVAGQVAVVAGFQGENEAGDITTLGRGGSDTTAVALAAALGADECQIYTDVDGVYTADPRVVPEARRLAHVTFEEMLELAGVGARVLQTRAVEFASKYNVRLRVLSTFAPDEGTLIIPEDETMEQPLISGVAYNQDEAKLTVLGVPDRPGIAARLLGPIASANIEVDMIVQNVSAAGTTDVTFTVHRNDYEAAFAILREHTADLGAEKVTGDNRIAKISLVGVGMRSHAGIASRMFEALAAESINIQMISTSEIKISVVVDEKYLELGVRALHAAFGLEEQEARRGSEGSN